MAPFPAVRPVTKFAIQIAVVAAYGGWYTSHPFDMGATISKALSAAASARSDKAKAAWAAADRSSQANGALMRCAPIGIWAHHADEGSAAARDDAALSHPHPVCQAASAAFVAAITTAIGGGDRDAMLTVGRDEINAVLERQRVEFEAWRIKSLAELRGWLEREGESLN